MAIKDAIENIDSLKKELESLMPMKKEDEGRLWKKFRLEFNYNSNHLEGNTLTYSETELLLIFNETKGSHTLREYDEMKGHDVAFELIQEWATSKEHPLTETMIKELNKIILKEPFWKEAETLDGQKTPRLIKIGNYKEFPNSVRLENGEIFKYSAPTDTPILMGELIQWYNKEKESGELNPPILAALFHYRFVLIHPFDDGNGRVSRLLMNYILLQNDLPPIIIKSTDKKNYLSALHRADAGDIDAFAQYITDQLLWSLELSIEAAKGNSIEELDDVDKEIGLWKKEILNVPETLLKNGNLVHKVYQNGIEKLLFKFIEKNRQFIELFNNSKVHLLMKNWGPGIEHTEKFDGLIESYISEDARDFFANEDLFGQNYIDLISIHIDFEVFKVADKKIVNSENKIKIQFSNTFYTVIFYEGKLLEKLYSQYISNEEIDKIINFIVKEMFEKLKAIPKKSN